MEKKKNRDWVKNAAIIFLAVLLVLTFFSNTIMNRSLPEVATQDVTSGSIVARVRGTGTVTAVGSNQVKADQNREIRSVLVKVGQKVEVGDVLFTLGQGTSEEIEAAEEKVSSLQASYNRTAASGPIYDYTSDWHRLQRLEKAREEAKNKMDRIADEIAGKYSPTPGYTDDPSVYGQNYTDTNQKRLEAVNAKIAAAQELVQKAEYLLNKQLEEKQSALNAAGNMTSAEEEAKRKQQEESLNKGLSDAEREQELYEDYEEASAELKEVEEKIKELEQQDSEAESTAAKLALRSLAIGDELRAIDLSDNSLEAEKALLDPTDEEDAKRIKEIDDEIADNDIKRTELENERAEIDSISSSATTKTNKEEIERLRREEKQPLESKIESIKIQCGGTPSDQTETIDSISAQLQALIDQGAKDLEIQAALDSLISVSEEDYEKAKEKLDAAILEKEILLEKIDKGRSTEYQAAKEAYESADEAYQSAYDSLMYSMASDAKSQSATGVELNDLQEQIDKAKAKLAELTGEDQQVTAKVSGVIQTIDCTAGTTVNKDDILCTIEVPDMGYTMSFSVTNDQANRLRPGDTATVSNFYWGNEVIATLNNIKVDPKNPQTNKLLTFDLEGNVTAGSELTISVGQKSANYDIIIPTSSIRTDANGSFVLRVDAKNSPLGNRYVAHRVQVEVLASDDSNSAVTGDLSYGDYVITTSNAPIKSGQLVRLADY